MEIHSLRQRFFLPLLTIFIITLLLSCQSNKADRELFVGSWREVQHGKKNWDASDFKYAITMSLDKNGTFVLDIPSSNTILGGTWSVGNIDTITFLVLTYQYHVPHEYDYDYYGGSNFNQYYFFKVNKVEKGKLYLVDMSSRYEENRIKEHLFKPQE